MIIKYLHENIKFSSFHFNHESQNFSQKPLKMPMHSAFFPDRISKITSNILWLWYVCFLWYSIFLDFCCDFVKDGFCFIEFNSISTVMSWKIFVLRERENEKMKIHNNKTKFNGNRLSAMAMSRCLLPCRKRVGRDKSRKSYFHQLPLTCERISVFCAAIWYSNLCSFPSWDEFILDVYARHGNWRCYKKCSVIIKFI